MKYGYFCYIIIIILEQIVAILKHDVTITEYEMQIIKKFIKVIYSRETVPLVYTFSFFNLS